MKILQVVQKPQRRGAEIFAFQLSSQLRLRGHSVRTAYLYPHRGDNPLPLASDDVELGGQERHGFEMLPGIHPLLLRRLRRLIGQWQPDVVQVNGGRTLKYGAMAKSSWRRRSWVLVYRSIGQPTNWVRGGLHRRLYAGAVMPQVDGIVAVSSPTRQALGRLYDLKVPITCIPRAVDRASLIPVSSPDSIRREARTAGSAPVVLYVGSLTEEKRLDRLVRVAATVRATVPGLSLWIVGEGPTRAALDAQVRSLDLDRCVHFIGVKADVASYMRAADVIALTSDTEGIPGVILEAGLLKRPVVATRVGGVSECVLNGQTGFVVDREDEDTFAAVLASLLVHPDQRRKLGEAAERWVQANFTLSRIAEEYEAFYKNVLLGALPQVATARLRESPAAPHCGPN